MSTAINELNTSLELASSFLENISTNNDFSNDILTEGIEEYKLLINSATG